MTDFYDEHLERKKKRRDSSPQRRNPIASTHGKGNWNAGPMKGKKDNKTRGKVRDFDDYTEDQW